MRSHRVSEHDENVLAAAAVALSSQCSVMECERISHTHSDDRFEKIYQECEAGRHRSRLHLTLSANMEIESC